jgi:hypothetical protein
MDVAISPIDTKVKLGRIGLKLRLLGVILD